MNLVMPHDRCFDLQHGFILSQLCKSAHFEVQKGRGFKMALFSLWSLAH